MTYALCACGYELMILLIGLWCLAIKHGFVGVDFYFVCCDCVHVLVLFVLHV